MKIAFVSTFDSFLRSNRILADALAESGIDGDHFVMMVRTDQITTDQIAGILGESPKLVSDVEGIIQRLSENAYDWVILSAENTSCRRFFEAFMTTEFLARRPLVATIYPGILFRHHFDGFSARMPADLVILNSRTDCSKFRELRATFGTYDDNSFELGPVTSFGSSRMRFEDDRNRVIFFDQPSVPRTREERTYIFDQLSRLAEAHPDLDFRVKLRVSPKQSTLHKGGQATLLTLNEFNARLPIGRKPLELVDGTSRDLIAGSRLCLSVSSTALVEAMSCGCPAAAIADFGIDEEYGASFFIGSGISCTLENLDPNHPPQPDAAWMNDHIGNPDLKIGALVLRLFADLAAHREIARPANSIHPFYGAKSFYAQSVRCFGARRAIERHFRSHQGPRLTRRVVKFFVKRFRQILRWLQGG